MRRSSETHFNSQLKAALFVLLFALILFAEYRFNLRGVIADILEWSKNQGVLGALVFILVYIISAVLLIPGTILTFAGAAIYGLFWGVVLVSIGSTMGAMLAFLIARYGVRNWLSRKMKASSRWAAIDEIVEEDGWKIVFLSRLSPLFPFNLLNYFYGITAVSFRDYSLASWLGMMPGIVLYVYLGSLAGDLFQADRERSNLEWAFYFFGLLATAALTLIITKRANAALKRKLPKNADTEDDE